MKPLAGLALSAALILLASRAPAAVDAATLAPAYAVDRFAAQRGEAPLWLREGVNGPAVRRLLQVLRDAPLDGFARGPELAEATTRALSLARSGNPVAVRQAERLLSSAWVLYVQALHWPTAGMIYSDPSLAPHIPAPSTVLADVAAAPSVERHVARVATVNPIYAELRQAALATNDRPLRAKLMANLDRARALPAGGRYVLVDLAAQKLWMMEGGRPAGSMRVVVGKAEMPTPLLAGTIRRATLNPYWNVPADLARKIVAANVKKFGPGYLGERGYEALSGWGADARPVSPSSVDWNAVAAGRTEVRVRQRPGPGNMMGSIKFEFAEREGIYLHDTPDQSLFANAARTASSGCVRLEDAARLGRWLLGREPVATGTAPEQHVALPQPVPVYVTYLTVRPEGGELRFAADIYGLDARAAARLAAR
jgi:murein L,D-transpeptidase YcbB/YkuD